MIRMKKIITIVCLSLIAFQFAGCKGETKKEETATPAKEKSYSHSLKKAENNINFIAYKTTDKVPVKGMFKEIKITKAGEGNSVKEAINGAEFKIPVSSIETNDSGRNFKIQKFFFSMMENTLHLTGKLSLTDDTNGTVAFTMNGITKELPFTYSIVENAFMMKTIMNVDNWNTETALASLNDACKELHKGADGISKTWNEVAIEVVSSFK